MKAWSLKVEMGRSLRVVRLTGPAPLSVEPNPLCAEIIRNIPYLSALTLLHAYSDICTVKKCGSSFLCQYCSPTALQKISKSSKKIVILKSVILMLFYPNYVQCRGKLCAKDVHRLLFRCLCVRGNLPWLHWHHSSSLQADRGSCTRLLWRLVGADERTQSRNKDESRTTDPACDLERPTTTASHSCSITLFHVSTAKTLTAHREQDWTWDSVQIGPSVYPKIHEECKQTQIWLKKIKLVKEPMCSYNSRESPHFLFL